MLWRSFKNAAEDTVHPDGKVKRSTWDNIVLSWQCIPALKARVKWTKNLGWLWLHLMEMRRQLQANTLITVQSSAHLVQLTWSLNFTNKNLRACRIFNEPCNTDIGFTDWREWDTLLCWLLRWAEFRIKARESSILAEVNLSGLRIKRCIDPDIPIVGARFPNMAQLSGRNVTAHLALAIQSVIENITFDHPLRSAS